jgi:predicted DsbA family dithiol-disulfide isomerase
LRPVAQGAAHWARSCGRFDDYHAALFRAFFERGEDIGQVPVLARLAENLGPDADALLQAPEAVGIHGVPAFAADRRAISSS